VPTDAHINRTFTFFGAISRALSRWWWLGFFLVAAAEISVHAVISANVPELRDWKAASVFVRAQFEPHDAVTVAPGWADPILRWFLGDRISLAMAGRNDLAAYDRLWALSIRDHQPEEAPFHKPDLVRQFGRVKVFRWKLPPRSLLYDLVEHVAGAEVAMVQRGEERACFFGRWVPGGGGGLGKGVIAPTYRAICDRARPWLWVAPVVMEDLDLKPRRCVWQHPAGQEPIRVTFRAVPLGRQMVFYGGLYYEHERMREGGPVEVSILINGKRVAQMSHRDGDGWAKLSIATGHADGATPTGDVTIEVSAIDPNRRGFCWAATTRGDALKEAP
jgi:hypothetical protein